VIQPHEIIVSIAHNAKGSTSLYLAGESSSSYQLALPPPFASFLKPWDRTNTSPITYLLEISHLKCMF
jgi:hypothetical protein